MSLKIYKYPGNKNVLEIKKLISLYWISKGNKKHILVRNKKVFDWLYFLKNNRYSFFITKNNQNKCNGFLGFFKSSKFSKKLKEMDVVWLSMWLSDTKYSNQKTFSGLSIMIYFIKFFKSKIIATVGCNDVTRNLYEKLGFKVGTLNHAYLLNPNIKYFKIAKIKSQNKIIKNSFLKVNYKIINNIDFLKNSNFEKKFQYTFKKDIDYFINRYQKNQFYKYNFLIFKKKNKVCFLMVIKKIKLNSRIVIRIIDFFGSYKALPELKESIFNLFENKSVEYLDFYYHGIPNLYINKLGLSIKSAKSKKIIPNYFEPFIRENIKINFAIKGKLTKNRFFLFKGDCDQERPN